MRYAKIRAARKSYCERPNPFFITFVRSTDEMFDKEVETAIHGCEDFDIWELTQSEFYDAVHEQASKEEERQGIRKAANKYKYMVG